MEINKHGMWSVGIIEANLDRNLQYVLIYAFWSIISPKGAVFNADVLLFPEGNTRFSALLVHTVL